MDYLIFVCLFFDILLFLYLILGSKIFLTQIFYNKLIKNSNTLWLDFSVTILLILLISILLTINIINKEIAKDAFDILMKIYPLILSINLVFNFIISIQLMNQIRKMIFNIKKEFIPSKTIKIIKSIKINNHFKFVHHLIKFTISMIIAIALTVYSILNSDRYNGNFYFIICLIEIIFIYILSKIKNYFINRQIFFKNNFVETFYTKNKIKLRVAIEAIIFKSICDIIIFIPLFINSIFNNENLKNLLNFIFHIFFGYVYIILFGNMLLSIERNNCIYINCLYKFFFMSNIFYFYLGNGKNSKFLFLNLEKEDDDKIDTLNFNDYFNENNIFTEEQENNNSKNNYNNYSIEMNDNLDSTIYSFDTTTIPSMKKTNTVTRIKTLIDENNIPKFINGDLNDEKFKKIYTQVRNKASDYSPCNFFIIIKLLFLYYTKNFKAFDNLNSLTDDKSFIKIKESILGLKKNNRASNINTGGIRLSNINIKNRISVINRNTISNINKFNTSMKFNLKDLMGNIEEYDMKIFFIKHLYNNLEKNFNERQKSYCSISNISITKNSIDDKIYELTDKLLPDQISSIDPSTNYTKSQDKKILNFYDNINNNDEKLGLDFKIESILSNVTMELYPYYELNIKDILKSLDISSNIQLFEKFFILKHDDNKYNNFFTNDSFLSYEIYDKKFLSYEQLANFMRNYHDYIINTVANFNYTFLPIILGIFNITYSSYNKIVILYRNSLAFSNDIIFKYWINYSFVLGDEIVTKSTDNNEIADIDEIEVKNNIILDEDEYDDTLEVLNKDLEFLRNMKYNLGFELNLFVIKESNNITNVKSEKSNTDFDLSFIKKNEDMKFSLVSNEDNKNDNENFINILRNTEFFGNNNASNSELSFKYFNNNTISLIEKLYLNESNTNKFFFKIYFSNIFKKKEEAKNNENSRKKGENSKEEINENEINENNKLICTIVKNKLMQKIGKSKNEFLNEGE